MGPEARDQPAEVAVDAEPASLLAEVAALAARLGGFAVAAIALGPELAGAFGLQAQEAELLAFAQAAADRRVPDAALDVRLAREPFVAGPPFLRSLVCDTLPGGGWLLLADPQPGRIPAAEAALREVSGLAESACRTVREDAVLRDRTRLAARADRMLRMVSQAESCTDALTGLLGELCRQHGAAAGRIWKLDGDGIMHEVSRHLEHDYYTRPPLAQVRAGNSRTAQAIASNAPLTTIYAQIDDAEQYALVAAAVESGLRSQVSYPIWVHDERFGIALGFPTEREDLDEIVQDVASLSDAIRPVLFRKVTEDRIRHLALHDELTQLANRSAFNQRLAEAVACAGRGEHGLALLYLDLDGFKRINDVRGHAVGDKLLALAAARMRPLVGAADTLARLGGDEFAVVQPGDGQPLAGMRLGRRLVEALNQPFEIDGKPSTIGASVGVAVYGEDGPGAEALLRNADEALYHAKAAGRNTARLFEPALARVREERFLLERDLREAVSTQSFALAYQPICDARTLRVGAMEALLRWPNPPQRPVEPREFVPVAEATGLIVPLGLWALETACAEAAGWGSPVRLSVNLSPLQFRQPGLAMQIAALLARTGLPGERLDLEITEGLLLDGSGEVLRTMQELREQGVRMTLDDFGTAYASLSYLRRFPFDQMKIDKSFVHGMIGDDGAQAIIEAMLSLGERLKLDVVAEGVETAEQLERLRQLGCTQVQGYLTGRPMPQDRARWLLGEGAPG